MSLLNLPKPLSFEWDKWNEEKIFKKHKITTRECEQAFMAERIFIQPDLMHSELENRFTLVSLTKSSRPIFIAFTIRNNSIRIISARNMHKKEFKIYEKEASSAKV